MTRTALLLLLVATTGCFAVPAPSGDESNVTSKKPGGGKNDDVSPPKKESDLKDPVEQGGGGGTEEDRKPSEAKPNATIYANTEDTLWAYSPIDNKLARVGAFSCVDADDSVLDIAVNRMGAMYGTTYKSFIKIDPATANCNVIATGALNSFPNSLTFVPAGTVAAEETLVGYSFDASDNATIYTRIDTMMGTMQQLSNLNASTSTQFALAGDFVSGFAVIKQNSQTGNDSLGEIDPRTGAVLRIVGDMGQKGFYGLGWYNNKGYGFASTGGIYEINASTGKATLLLDAKDGLGKSIVWYGGG